MTQSSNCFRWRALNWAQTEERKLLLRTAGAGTAVQKFRVDGKSLAAHVFWTEPANDSHHCPSSMGRGRPRQRSAMADWSCEQQFWQSVGGSQISACRVPVIRSSAFPSHSLARSLAIFVFEDSWSNFKLASQSKGFSMALEFFSCLMVTCLAESGLSGETHESN